MRGNLIGVPLRQNKACNVAASNFASTITSTGKSWLWGPNAQGGLGDNSIISRSYPILVSGATKTFCKIIAGSSFSISIDTYGKVWGWGNNMSGQLGQNNITCYSTPVSVKGAAKTFCIVAAGSSHSLAIDKYGRAWAWGLNGSGVLGDNTITARCTPVSVVGAVKTFCAITGGQTLSAAIDKNGNVWTWGNPTLGQLGNNTSTGARSTPISISGALKTFCKIAANLSVNCCLAIDKYGMVWGWGNNTGGILGRNNISAVSTPVSVCGAAKTFCEISSNACSGAIDKYGKVWMWGSNANGVLGRNDNASANSVLTPVSICGAAKTFCKLAIGDFFVIGIDNQQRIWAWGSNLSGQLGNNDSLITSTPTAVSGAKKTFCRLAGNYQNTICADNRGLLWGWGNNLNASLGQKVAFSIVTPTCISGPLKTFCQIATQQTYSAALDQNGRAWAWGANGAGQLGQNNLTAYCTPVSVLGAIKTFCKIAVDILNASGATLAIDKNGRAWGWGYNLYGTLGRNSSTNYSTPISVCGAVKTFCVITLSNFSASALDKNGKVWSWGYNSVGQLGTNNTVSYSTPVSIGGAAKTFCAIETGTASRLAIDLRGTIWAWGANLSGQLGTNNLVSYSTPVSVLGAAKTFCKVAAGTQHSLAIDKNGRLWAWGLNSSGQLGTNNLTAYSTPVSVLGAAKTFCLVAAGNTVSTAIDKYGNVWTWGRNNQGQLGNSLRAAYPTPVRVYNF